MREAIDALRKAVCDEAADAKERAASLFRDAQYDAAFELFGSVTESLPQAMRAADVALEAAGVATAAPADAPAPEGATGPGGDGGAVADAAAARHRALELRVAAHGNRALVCQTRQDWHGVVTESDAVLALAPANQKARLRRMVARENLGELKGALADAEALARAGAHAGGAHAAVRDALARLRAALEAQRVRRAVQERARAPDLRPRVGWLMHRDGGGMLGKMRGAAGGSSSNLAAARSRAQGAA